MSGQFSICQDYKDNSKHIMHSTANQSIKGETIIGFDKMLILWILDSDSDSNRAKKNFNNKNMNKNEEKPDC